MQQIRMKRDHDRFRAGEVITHHDVVAEAWVKRGLATKDLTMPAVVKPIQTKVLKAKEPEPIVEVKPEPIVEVKVEEPKPEVKAEGPEAEPAKPRHEKKK